MCDKNYDGDDSDDNWLVNAIQCMRDATRGMDKDDVLEEFDVVREDVYKDYIGDE